MALIIALTSQGFSDCEVKGRESRVSAGLCNRQTPNQWWLLMLSLCTTLEARARPRHLRASARAVKGPAGQRGGQASSFPLSGLGFPDCGTRAAQKPPASALASAAGRPPQNQQNPAPTWGLPPNPLPRKSPGVSTATACPPRHPRRPAARLTTRRNPIGSSAGSASQSARAHAPLASLLATCNPAGSVLHCVERPGVRL